MAAPQIPEQFLAKILLDGAKANGLDLTGPIAAGGRPAALLGDLTPPAAMGARALPDVYQGGLMSTATPVDPASLARGGRWAIPQPPVASATLTEPIVQGAPIRGALPSGIRALPRGSAGALGAGTPAEAASLLGTATPAAGSAAGAESAAAAAARSAAAAAGDSGFPGPVGGAAGPATEAASKLGRYGKMVAKLPDEGFGGWLAKAAPQTLGRAVGSGIAGIGTNMLSQAILDQLIGGSVEDKGFSWGGLGKATGAGAAGGGVAGAIGGGGAGAIPGALIGALLGAGSYAFSDLTTPDTPTLDETKATLRQLGNQYDTDPRLINQVLGQYEAMARFYTETGQTDKLNGLAEQAFTQLSGVLGTPAPEPVYDPAQASLVNDLVWKSAQPYLDRLDNSSPYKVALLENLAQTPRQYLLDSQRANQELAAQGAAALGSGQGAAMAAGLTPDMMKQLESAGIAM